MALVRLRFINLFVFEDEEAGDTRIGLYATVTNSAGAVVGEFRWNHRNGSIEDNFDYPLDGDAQYPSVLQFDVTGQAKIFVKAYTDNDERWPSEGQHENFLGDAEVLFDTREPSSLGQLTLGPTTTDNGNTGYVVTADVGVIQAPALARVRLVFDDIVIINAKDDSFTHAGVYIRAYAPEQGGAGAIDEELLRWNNNGERIYREAKFSLSYGTPTTVFDRRLGGPTRILVEAYTKDDNNWPGPEDYDRFLGRVMFVIDPADPTTLGSLRLGPTRTDETHQGYLLTMSAERLALDATPNLEIVGAEITQGIQTYKSEFAPDNALPMIAGRATLVRAYLDSGIDPNINGGQVANVTGTLTLGDGGPPIAPIAAITARPIAQVDRAVLGHTLNFRIPASRLVAGKLTAVVQADVGGQISNPVEIIAEVLDVPPVDVIMVRVETGQFPAPSEAQYYTAVNRLPEVYPLADDPATSVVYWIIPGNEVIHTTRDLSTLKGMRKFLGDLEDLHEDHAPEYKKIYALLDDRVPMERVGIARPSDNIAFGRAGLVSAVAHELGHVFGLEHAPCGANPAPEDTDPDYWPANGSIGDVGLDVARLDVYPAGVGDFMSYCSTPGPNRTYDRWIGPFHWSRLTQLLRGRRREPAPVAARPPEFSGDPVSVGIPFPGPFVRVRGTVSRTGVVEWDPAVRTFSEDSAEASERAAASSYQVSVEDASGRVLAAAPTEVRFLAADATEAGFTARLPYQNRTHRIVLRRAGAELGALVVPPAPPRTLLLAPSSAAQIDPAGILHLRWNQLGGNNPSDPPAVFTIRFGNTDRTVALRPGVGLTGDSFDLDLRELPGHKRCFVQVLATNGYHTSYLQTPMFALPVRPPRILLAAIEGPVLSVQGSSPQHGPLTGPAITWEVNGRPSSVTGGAFDVRALGGGQHRIRVLTRDPDGLATDTVLGNYDGTTGLRLPSAPGM